jgi:hypothetical protein
LGKRPYGRFRNCQRLTKRDPGWALENGAQESKSPAQKLCVGVTQIVPLSIRIGCMIAGAAQKMWREPKIPFAIGAQETGHIYI